MIQSACIGKINRAVDSHRATQRRASMQKNEVSMNPLIECPQEGWLPERASCSETYILIVPKTSRKFSILL